MASASLPLISIAMATCNGEKFIAAQIESIMSQTYTNIELIICDDLSQDNTIHFIREYASTYPQIKLYRNKKRLGFVKNFEQAISLCLGSYIALCDQDDIWYPEKLTTYIQHMQKTEQKHPGSPVMLHSDMRIIDNEDNLLHDSYFQFKHYKLNPDKDLGHIAGPCGVMGNTIMMNRSLTELILPFADCVALHDYWIALINELKGKRVTLDFPLSSYRIHETNTSNTTQKTSASLSLVQKINGLFKKSITPPFIGSHRSCIIQYVMQHFSLDMQDRTLLIHFQTYLRQEGSKLARIYYLFHHSLLKRDLRYRLEVLINLLFHT